jgi:hypothetical protein
MAINREAQFIDDLLNLSESISRGALVAIKPGCDEDGRKATRHSSFDSAIAASF